jgi:hypothetical protein
MAQFLLNYYYTITTLCGLVFSYAAQIKGILIYET